MKSFLFTLATAASVIALGASTMAAQAADVTVGGVTYTNKGLVAAGRLPSNLRDKFGETFGSSSGAAVVPQDWKRTATGYEGTLLLLPDRGYNAAGTTDYKDRVNTVGITLTPAATGGKLEMKLSDSTILNDDQGQYMSGIDPESVRKATGAMPDLPLAANGHITLDPEAIIRLADGSLLISDEYGPYIFHFSSAGKLISAIRPPDAFIPMRKGVENFSANAPGPGGHAPDPANPETGRQNNQGFEGMALAPDGKTLAVVLQSANRQDGGDAAPTRRYTRALFYDISNPDQAKLTAEYVVPLPVFKDAGGNQLVAAQSELTALSTTQFLLLSRDSNNGQGLKGSTSVYRKIGILDFAGATNIAGTDFDKTKPVAPKGALDEGVKPATLTDFIDINDNTELAKIGLHNGEPNDRNNLSEKWESMALASALDPAAPQDYFLFVGNDNDFLTQDGFQVGAPYKADNNADVDTILLVYRITVPTLPAAK